MMVVVGLVYTNFYPNTIHSNFRFFSLFWSVGGVGLRLAFSYPNTLQSNFRLCFLGDGAVGISLD